MNKIFLILCSFYLIFTFSACSSNTSHSTVLSTNQKETTQTQATDQKETTQTQATDQKKTTQTQATDQKETTQTQATDQKKITQNNHQKVHWGYTGETSPEHWGKLSKKYSACAEGKKQSPVNLTNFIKSDLSPLNLNYNANVKEILNNGHSVQVNFSKGSSLIINQQQYQLIQVHFHTPSENIIDGISYPMEAHFVHKTMDGKLAVLAVLYHLGDSNIELEKIWKKMPENVNEKFNLNIELTAFDLLPKEQAYYQFEGSLTTPPCTEGVNWYVIKQTLPVSQQQIDKFSTLMKHPNNRPVQPINNRSILY